MRQPHYIFSGALIPRKYAPFLIVVICLLAAACSLPVSPARLRSVQQADTEATQAAYAVLTEIARPSNTPTVSPTPRPSPTVILPSATPTLAPSETPPPGATAPPPKFSVTAQPGLELATQSDLTDYVFQVDWAVWKNGPEGAGLVHQRISGCQVHAAPAHGLSAPKRLLWEDYGRFRWEILDYGGYAFVTPVLGSSLSSGQNGSYLELDGYDRAACRADQEQLLADLLTRGQAMAQSPATLFRSPTPRSNPDGFSCPNTPPARLRVGDYLSVVTDGLWLRAEPKADGEKIRKFLRYAPYSIRVIGGPVCDKYVYWQVQVTEFGEGGSSFQGWLAEGDPSEVYAIPVK